MGEYLLSCLGWSLWKTLHLHISAGCSINSHPPDRGSFEKRLDISGKPCPSFLQICVRIMCVTQSFLRNSLFLGKENENLLLDRNCTVQFR